MCVRILKGRPMIRLQMTMPSQRRLKQPSGQGKQLIAADVLNQQTCTQRDVHCTPLLQSNRISIYLTCHQLSHAHTQRASCMVSVGKRYPSHAPTNQQGEQDSHLCALLPCICRHAFCHHGHHANAHVMCTCHPWWCTCILSPAHVIRGGANTDYGQSSKHNKTYISQASSFLPVLLSWYGAVPCPGSCSTNACVEHESGTCDVACQHARNVWYYVCINFMGVLALHRPLHSVARVRLRLSPGVAS